MGDPIPTDELRRRADAAAELLQDDYMDQDVATARTLIRQLRDRREFEKLMVLVEALSRIDPEDPGTRRLYAQALIDTGKASIAIDVLRALVSRLPPDHPEAYEAQGLIGRAYKQIYIDSRVKGSEPARQALLKAIEAYRKPYEADPPLLWHGVNLLALLDHCRRRGIVAPVSYEPRTLAVRLLEQLDQLPAANRDEWQLAMIAEASLGTRDWAVIEPSLKQYVQAPGVEEFHLNSTLRQFTEIWNLGESARGKAILEILRARLLPLKNASIELAPHEVAEVAADKSQFEAILGKEGARSLAWWRTGLDRARSVAAIRQKLADRVGTGFLVRAGDLGREPADERLVLTNFHVVNSGGLRGGLTADQAEIVFEAVDSQRKYLVKAILWESPEEECDAALLQLVDPPSAADPEAPAPMPLAKGLALRGVATRVYVIGHPGGRELSFSLQDNELIDHEGPKDGKPAIPGVVRVHYRAPTEGGSSGSPVFNASEWQVVALHHKGGMLGMPKLNGVAGTYAANEGIWLQSIIERMK